MLTTKHAALLSAMLLFFTSSIFAADNDNIDLTAPNPNSTAAVDRREQKEEVVEANPFAITFYKQNYVLPFYYTGSPYNKVYLQQTPQGQHIKSTEIKFQLSLKVPVWKHILGSNSNLYFGYTQLSYWQAYNKNAFFRETDFQPELFINNQLCIPLVGDWIISAVNLGAIHESNGYGYPLERSWNRIYFEAIASTNRMMLSLRPWYVIHDSTYQMFNPNMASYLGYGDITFSYKVFSDQVLTLQMHNLIEGGGRHATAMASYTFPMTRYLHGFVQVFSGYGQSLIEYNHRTNSVGVGIALNNLI